MGETAMSDPWSEDAPDVEEPTERVKVCLSCGLTFTKDRHSALECNRELKNRVKELEERAKQFEETSAYLLEKNAELYRRLAKGPEGEE